MCVDPTNCGGYCPECQHDTIKRLRARIAELERAADGARLELVENDEHSRENAIAVLRAALTGKQP